MKTTLIQMTVLMLCGAGWRFFEPRGLSAEQTRLVLTSSVYYFFLPAMVLDVLWKADIGVQSLQLSALGVAAVLLGLLLTWLISRLFRFKPAQTGAIMLATAFPNVTYLGLPVLEQAFGGWARSVAIQIDLFAASPLLFTIGVAVARHYGSEKGPSAAWWTSFNTPPFWAAMVALLLNVNGVVAPIWLQGLLEKLSAVVPPLMIFSLGMALSWRSIRLKNLPYIAPVALLRLMVIPWLAAWLAVAIDLQETLRAAAVIDLAMPSMVLGIVFCDRYRLDSGLYATAVTVTTALSLISLPFWFSLL